MKSTATLIAIAIVALTLVSCSLFEPAEPETQRLAEHRVSTSTGIVQGQSSDQALVSWFDIPFAQPPVDDLRWKAPRTLNSPEQIIVARETKGCVQVASRYGGAEGEGIVGAEDCLYLDIRAPADFAEKQYPVMFWIHGGGNTTGLKDFYDFSKMVVSQDVVVVTTNYRLSALGWFTHPAIQGLQQGLDKTSNFGTLDLIESLKWVQANIGQFGGDANNVTIFGESAGGHNVFTLLASPLADGLFHRAISQSGYTTSSSMADAYNREGANQLIERGSWQIVEQITNSASQLEQSDYSTEELRSLLLGMDAAELMALYHDGSERFDSIPLTTADGVVVPEQGTLATLASAEYAKNIPVIAGATKDEVALWLAMHRYFMEAKYYFTKLLPPKIDTKDPELYELWVRLRSHAWKLKGVDQALAAMESAGYQNLYAYQFDWDHQQESFFIDFPRLFGAAHGTDIAFVTGNFVYGPVGSYIYPEGPARDEMESTMMSAWTNFARSAIPDTGKGIEWQPFTTAAPAYLHLDKDDLLRMDSEQETIESLLGSLAEHRVPTDYQRCYIAWETYNNVGDPDPQAYREWKNGLCADVDMRAEQRALAARLIEEFGSIGVL